MFAPVVAGENGVCFSVIFGNREALVTSLREGSFGEQTYATGPSKILDGLVSTLTGV